MRKWRDFCVLPNHSDTPDVLCRPSAGWPSPPRRPSMFMCHAPRTRSPPIVGKRCPAPSRVFFWPAHRGEPQNKAWSVQEAQWGINLSQYHLAAFPKFSEPFTHPLPTPNFFVQLARWGLRLGSCLELQGVGLPIPWHHKAHLHPCIVLSLLRLYGSGEDPQIRGLILVFAGKRRELG